VFVIVGVLLVDVLYMWLIFIIGMSDDDELLC